MIKAGQILGLSRPTHPKRVDLLVQVESIYPEKFVFWVINGAWQGTLVYPNQLEVSGYPEYTGLANICWTGYVPPGNYDTRMEYINHQLQTSMFNQIINRVRFNVLMWLKSITFVSRIIFSLEAGYNGFKTAWQCKKVRLKNRTITPYPWPDDFEDDIPF